MKYLKILLVAMVMLFAFASAKAQVVVRARIGDRGHYRHHPVYHHHYYWRHGHRYSRRY